jgi:hypothetical protein
MKIVDRKTFLSLPFNTVYAKYKPCVFDEICIKGDSTDFNDFWVQYLLTVEREGEEVFDVLDRMEKGDNVRLDLKCESRDGLFDEDQMFAVFEKDDITNLINRLEECL